MTLQFDSSDHTLHCINNEGEDVGSFCEGFIVIKTLVDIDNRMQFVVLKVFTKAETFEVKIEAENFATNSIARVLLANGVNLLSDPDTSLAVAEYFLESKKNAPIEFTYSRLGWSSYRKKKVFLSDHMFQNDKELLGCRHENPAKLLPVGSFEA